MDEKTGLDPEDEAFIDEAVRSGRFASRAELISEGVQLVRKREERVAAIRAAVQRGLEDVKAGRVVDVDEAFDQIETLLDEMEAAKKA